MGNLKAVYPTGRVIERDCTASFGLRLPFPDGRPIKIILMGDIPYHHIKHAQFTVCPNHGKVIVDGEYEEVE